MKLKYLVFLLAKQRYAHPIDSIREIMCYLTPTPVPGTAEEILGVLNARGEIVTVISGRALFDLEDSCENNQQRIIVIDLENDLVGLVVDAVEEIVTFQGKPQEASHDLSNVRLITGTIQHEERLHILIDLK